MLIFYNSIVHVTLFLCFEAPSFQQRAGLLLERNQRHLEKQTQQVGGLFSGHCSPGLVPVPGKCQTPSPGRAGRMPSATCTGLTLQQQTMSLKPSDCYKIKITNSSFISIYYNKWQDYGLVKVKPNNPVTFS